MLLGIVDAHSKGSEKLTERLGDVFNRFDCPKQLVSDNGPQFTSQKFKKLSEVNGLSHIRSALHHPSTN